MMTAMSKRTYSLEELAKHVSGQVQGDGNITISAVGTLSGAASHQISFLTNPKYKPQLKDTQAGAVILHKNLKDDSPVPALVVANPHAAFALIAQLFDTTPAVATGIAESAVIAPSARIGSDVSLGHNVIIEENVVLGDRVTVGANTVIRRGTHIGEGCTNNCLAMNCHALTNHNVMIDSYVRVNGTAFTNMGTSTNNRIRAYSNSIA